MPEAEDDDAPGDIAMKGVKLQGAPLYLDSQATTMLDPRVLDRMMPWQLDQFGNPHSRTHMYGWEAEDAVEKARGHIAALVGADPREIVFTSGATESNNMALKGVAHFYAERKRHVITLQTEHKCVLDSCRYLQQKGFDVTYLPVQPDGLLDLDLLRDSIRPDTALVSAMFINNEIGVIQDVERIGQICREKGVFFHTGEGTGPRGAPRPPPATPHAPRPRPNPRSPEPLPPPQTPPRPWARSRST